jgi:hypothetical protein
MATYIHSRPEEDGLAQKAGSGEKAGSEPSKCRVRTKVPGQGPDEVQGECRVSAEKCRVQECYNIFSQRALFLVLLSSQTLYDLFLSSLPESGLLEPTLVTAESGTEYRVKCRVECRVESEFRLKCRVECRVGSEYQAKCQVECRWMITSMN